jgi:hypothetical protein
MAKPLLKKPSVEPGAVIDGFTVGACIHRGGLATLWSVTRADVTVPLLMKIPRISEGDDPAAIVGFEMEQDDPAAAVGAACACRRSCCAVWRSSRSGDNRPLRNWRSNSAIRTRSN